MNLTWKIGTRPFLCAATAVHSCFGSATPPFTWCLLTSASLLLRQYTSKLPETDEINIIVFQGSEFYLSGALRPNNNSRTDISKVTPLVTKEFKYLIAVDRLDQRISFPRERPYRAVTFIIHNQSKSVYNQYLLTEGKRFRSLFSAL